MDPATEPEPGVLLIQSNSILRKALRRELDRDGYALLAVNSLGEAVARLRSMSYRLVVCTDAQRSVAWTDDYELLIDTRGLLARSGGRYELYLPGIGVHAQAVLIMPCIDASSVRSTVSEVMVRLNRMSSSATGDNNAPGATLSEAKNLSKAH